MEIFPFIVKNWYLFAALALVLVLLAMDPIRRKMLRVPLVSPAQAVTLMNRSQGIVLDVRDANDYKAGHIVGAIGIPVKELPQRTTELRKLKGRPVIISSRIGSAALSAAAVLRREGFETVNILAGGMQAWERSQLPLEK
jgi:rhodanese-related sulfurtransferase